MRAIKEINVEISPRAARDIKGFLKRKGYNVCEVIRVSAGGWRAVVTKKKDFIIATVFTKNEKIAGLRVSL